MPITQSNNIGFGNYGIYNSKNIGYGGRGIYSPELSQSDPVIEALIKANCTMYLDPNKANGTSKGINTPLTNPLKDLIGSNDATLVNFNGTVESGYDDLTLPNTNVKTFLKADGIDDYGAILDNASLDPTGTEDFAICGVFKTGATLQVGFLFAKALNTNASEHQYALIGLNTGVLSLRITGFSTTIGTVLVNTLYSFEIKRINGVLKTILNEVESYNAPNASLLVNQGDLSVFNRVGTGTLFQNYALGYLTFFYNGATGLNETDVDAACALLKAPYF